MRSFFRISVLRFVFLPAVLAVIPAKSTFAQDQRVSEILSKYQPDVVYDQLRRICGDLPVNLNGIGITIESRFFNKPGNAYAAQYLKQQLSSYGLVTFSRSFSANGSNVFGIKYGSVYPERVYIIGAHYDNLPPGNVAPGADDNGSGCAAVLEAARLFSTVDFPNTVIFAFWDEEELGLIGSAAYVESGVHGDSLLGYINLDMIGWDGNDDNISEIHSRPIGRSVELAELASSCNSLYDIGLTIQMVNPGSVNTDHFSFWQGGKTAIGINEEYDDDQNPHYHSASDEIQYLDTAYLHKSARLAIATLASLAFDNKGEKDASTAVSLAKVFPNPAADQVRLLFPQMIPGTVNIKVSDSRGKTIYSDQAENPDHFDIVLTGFSAGMYNLSIVGEGFSHRLPFVKN